MWIYLIYIQIFLNKCSVLYYALIHWERYISFGRMHWKSYCQGNRCYLLFWTLGGARHQMNNCPALLPCFDLSYLSASEMNVWLNCTLLYTYNYHQTEQLHASLTLTARRIDPMMNLLAGLFSACSSLLSPSCSPFCPSPSFCSPSSCPFCSCSSAGPNGYVISMSPSSRAIFSPLKLGFSYSTHLKRGRRGQRKRKTLMQTLYLHIYVSIVYLLMYPLEFREEDNTYVVIFMWL